MMFAGRWNCITWNECSFAQKELGIATLPLKFDGHLSARIVFLNSDSEDFYWYTSCTGHVSCWLCVFLQTFLVYEVVIPPLNHQEISPQCLAASFSADICSICVFFSLNDREQRPPTAPKLAPIPVALGTLRPSKPAKVAGKTEQKTWMIDRESLFLLEVVW